MTKMKTERNNHFFTKADAKEIKRLLDEKAKIEIKIGEIEKEKIYPSVKKMFKNEKIINWYISEPNKAVRVETTLAGYLVDFKELAKER